MAPSYTDLGSRAYLLELSYCVLLRNTRVRMEKPENWKNLEQLSLLSGEALASRYPDQTLASN